MDYSKIKTRIKNKLTRTYKKTSYNEDYLKTETQYKRTRDSVKTIEAEIKTLLHAFSAPSLYDNIASGLYGGLELVKGTLAGGTDQGSPKPAKKETEDIFGVFAISAYNMSQSVSGEASRRFSDLSSALKKVSAARLHLKDSITQNLNIISELKEKAKVIDERRIELLRQRQEIEGTKEVAEEERKKRKFVEMLDSVYSDMHEYSSSPGILEISTGVGASLKNFFGDSFDALAETEPMGREGQ